VSAMTDYKYKLQSRTPESAWFTHLNVSGPSEDEVRWLLRGAEVVTNHVQHLLQRRQTPEWRLVREPVQPSPEVLLGTLESWRPIELPAAER
jgi:hypothetical protein